MYRDVRGEYWRPIRGEDSEVFKHFMSVLFVDSDKNRNATLFRVKNYNDVKVVQPVAA